MAVLVIIFSLFLRYTVLGRQIYAVGSNEQAARLSGVPVNLVKLFVYTVTGTLAALSGIITAGLLATAATNAGMGSELDVIAAVVIGGASLAGGEGTIIGSIIGAAIMAVLRNAFILLQVPDLYADHHHRRRHHPGGGRRPDAPAQKLTHAAQTSACASARSLRFALHAQQRTCGENLTRKETAYRN